MKIRPFLSSLFLVVNSLLLGTSLSAAAESDFQSWGSLIFQGPTQNQFRLYFEYQPRFANGSSQLDRVITRPAIVFSLGDASSVFLGYAWTPPFQPKYSSEQRLWQQFSHLTPGPGGTFILRSRLEQRWIDEIPDLAVRFRQMLRFQSPIATSDDTLWVAYDELFFHLNSPSSAIQAGYDQNRLFLGINQRIHPLIRAELGYLFNHINRSGKTDRILHAALLTTTINF